MHPIAFVIDVLFSFYATPRFWFWVCMAFIAVGLVAIVGNLIESSKARF